MTRFFMQVAPVPELIERLHELAPGLGWTIVGEPVPPGADPHWLYEIDDPAAPAHVEGKTITPAVCMWIDKPPTVDYHNVPMTLPTADAKENR